MNRIIQNTILVGFKMWKKVSTDSPEKAVEHITKRIFALIWEYQLP